MNHHWFSWFTPSLRWFCAFTRRQARKRRAAARGRRCVFEGLEPLVLLTSDPLDSGGVAAITTELSQAPPTVHGIANLTLDAHQYLTGVDLSTAFGEGDEYKNFTFTITGNSNPDLLTWTCVGVGPLPWLMGMGFSHTSGTVDVTVRATNAARRFSETTFSVTVPEVTPPQDRDPGGPNIPDSPEDPNLIRVVSGEAELLSIAALADGTDLVIDSGATFRLAEDISEDLPVSGPGIVVSGGTLQLGEGDVAGTVNSAIGLDDAVLEFAGAADQTFSQDIADYGSGTGQVLVTGGGVVTLDGTNTYSYGTDVTAGVLAFGANSTVPTTGQILLEDHGALAAAGPSNYTTVQDWITSGLIDDTSTGTLCLTASTYTSDITLADTGYSYSYLRLGAMPGVEADCSGSSGQITPGPQGYMFGGGGGTLTVSSALIDTCAVHVRGDTHLTSTSNAFTGPIGLDEGQLKVGSGALPGSCVISVNSSAGNWVGGVLSASGAYGSVADWLLYSHVSPASTGTIGLTPNDTADIDFTGYDDLYLGAAAASVVYTGTITPANGVYQLGGGLPLTVTSTLEDDGQNMQSLSVRGDVTLANSSANTFSDGTTLLAGTLSVSDADNLGDGPISFAGGGLQVIADTTIAAGLDVAADGRIATDHAVTLAGAITGSHNLTAGGGGTFIVNQNNSSFTGDILVSESTLQLGDGTTNGSVGGDIVNQGAVVFNTAENTSPFRAVGVGGETKARSV